MKPTDICKDESLLAPVMNFALADLRNAGWQFKVVETLRTKERQEMLVATGKSKTHNSKHFSGYAADVLPLPGGYDTPRPLLIEMQKVWCGIAKKYGYPNNGYLDWDLCHVSLNDGKWI
jgi:hypothetical protein